MEVGERAEGGESFAAETEGRDGIEVVVGSQLRGPVFEGYGFVVVGSNAGAVVDDFDGIEAAVLEADL